MNGIQKTRVMYLIVFMCTVTAVQSLRADAVADLKAEWESFKNAPDLAKNMWQGLTGSLPDSFYYNYRVWNDSPAEVIIGAQGMINLQGMKIEGDYHTFAGFAYNTDFHQYILCPPFLNTGTLGYKTLLTMQLYMSLFQDVAGIVYPSSFQEFETYNNNRIARNKKFGLRPNDLITKDVLELPWQKSRTGVLSYFGRKLKPTYEKDTFARQMLAITNESGLTKNSIISDTYEQGEATIEYDKNLYFYHAYRDKTGVKGEYLGWGGIANPAQEGDDYAKTQNIKDVPGVTTAFAGTFYVSSARKDLFMTFYKDGVTYTVALESGSFNLLQSTEVKKATKTEAQDENNPFGVDIGNETAPTSQTVESIRPSEKNQFTEKFGFQFYQGDPAKNTTKIAYIPIASVGPAYVYDTRTPAQALKDATTRPAEVKNGAAIQAEVGGPRPYTYELYDAQNKVMLACHSLRVGMAPLPGTPGKEQVRDINPVACHVWVQSADDVMKATLKEYTDAGKTFSYAQIPYDLSEQKWIAYQTKDSTVVQKLTGSLTEIKVIRPRISEKTARLYICSVATQDDNKAQQFMKRLASGAITLPATHQEVSDITKVDIAATLSKAQANTYGIIVDAKGTGATGISGALLVTDLFTPSGLGSADRYYYVFPPQLDVSILAGMLPLEKRMSDADMEAFSKQVVTWIDAYQKQGKDAAVQTVTRYLQQFGAKELFVDQGQGALTAQAKKMVENYVTGMVSLSHLPLIRQAGFAYPFLGAVPEGWPKESAKPA